MNNSKNKEKKATILNWWYYHKWYVVCGLILFAIALDLLFANLEIRKEQPDYQIAYVASLQLPEDIQTALEETLGEMGEDLNEDGKVVVQIHQYTSGNQAASADAEYFKYGSEITLVADINDYDSYFFLMEDPVAVQKKEQILALPDGSCPDNYDFSVSGKVYRWSDCPVLTNLSLGTYTESAFGNEVTGDSQAFLSGLFFGRRCFYDESRFKYLEGCDALWHNLIKDAKETTPDDFL